MKPTEIEQEFLKGYANALQDVMLKLTGNNHCSKSYDPSEFWDDKLHSYAFDLKDGGRHHPLSDYKNIKEITDLMLTEVVCNIDEHIKNN